MQKSVATSDATRPQVTFGDTDEPVAGQREYGRQDAASDKDRCPVQSDADVDEVA